MSDDNGSTPARVRWARLRLNIIGQLLAAPPPQGELWARIEELAVHRWQHPTRASETITFAAKTIERWLYAARDAQDPVRALERKVPKHAGQFPSVTVVVAAELRQFRRDHPTWSYQLVHDNLMALARKRTELQPVPSYPTVRRYMKHHGLEKRRRRRGREETFERRETRSFEVTHVGGLWHFDFHEARRKVLCADGGWHKPILFAILDDNSRLCCHAQWYLAEDTECLVHGLSQALQKRGLPRAVLSDNGAAMIAAETTCGLSRLSIIQHTTLPATPEQNGKQEHFFSVVEGRLMAMLEGDPALTLDLLNRATAAWYEIEYNRRVHSETREAPLDRFLRGPSVGRDCPSSDALRRAFRTELTRKQRRSDGTFTAFGVRFEVPSAYRTLVNLSVRVARWDLSSVDLVDKHTGEHLATVFPIDKAKNAERRRRVIPTARVIDDDERRPAGIAPLLRELMAEYAATGIPPAFIPKDVTDGDDDKQENET